MGYLSLSFHSVFLHFASPSPIHSVPPSYTLVLLHLRPIMCHFLDFLLVISSHLLLYPPPPSPPCHVNDQLMAIGKAIWAIVSRSVEPFQKISRVHTHTHTHTTRVLCNTPCLPLTVWSNKSFSVSIQSAVYASKPLFYSHGRWVRPQQ